MASIFPVFAVNWHNFFPLSISHTFTIPVEAVNTTSSSLEKARLYMGCGSLNIGVDVLEDISQTLIPVSKELDARKFPLCEKRTMEILSSVFSECFQEPTS